MLRFLIALWAAKLSVIALKITHHNGTNFPGVVALKLCPDFLKYVGKPKKFIAITGTNGKTTTVNLVLDMLHMDGQKVVDNNAGSNINSGIITSLCKDANLFGKLRSDIALFEVDERSVIRIFPYMEPDLMLVNNLSRDSVARNAHPQFIADFMTKYVPEHTQMILNADDLICSSVAQRNKDRVFFGIDSMPGDRKDCINLINDLAICPKCAHKLEYDYLRYSHIGRAHCPSCGFHAPDYDFKGHNIDLDTMTIDVTDASGTGHYRLLNDSTFNIYNVVSSVTVMRRLGYTHEQIEHFYENLKITASRLGVTEVKGRKICLMLTKAKNAFATSRVSDYISQQEGDKEIVLMNSDSDYFDHGSENICWLYDADFEFLNQDNIKHIVACGPRRADYKTRLLLAGIPEERIDVAETMFDAPPLMHLFPNDTIYIMYGADTVPQANRVSDMIKERIESQLPTNEFTGL